MRSLIRHWWQRAGPDPPGAAAHTPAAAAGVTRYLPPAAPAQNAPAPFRPAVLRGCRQGGPSEGAAADPPPPAAAGSPPPLALHRRRRPLARAAPRAAPLSSALPCLPPAHPHPHPHPHAPWQTPNTAIPTNPPKPQAANSVVKGADKAADKVEKAIDDTVTYLQGKGKVTAAAARGSGSIDGAVRAEGAPFATARPRAGDRAQAVPRRRSAGGLRDRKRS
jgi:hypothetical protein